MRHLLVTVVTRVPCKWQRWQHRSRRRGARCAPLCGVVAVAVRLRLAARRCRPAAALPGVAGSSTSSARCGVLPRPVFGVNTADCARGGPRLSGRAGWRGRIGPLSPCVCLLALLVLQAAQGSAVPCDPCSSQGGCCRTSQCLWAASLNRGVRERGTQRCTAHALAGARATCVSAQTACPASEPPRAPCSAWRPARPRACTPTRAPAPRTPCPCTGAACAPPCCGTLAACARGQGRAASAPCLSEPCCSPARRRPFAAAKQCSLTCPGASHALPSFACRPCWQ